MSNILRLAAKHPRIVLQFSNCKARGRCDLCHAEDNMESGLVGALDGEPGSFVCDQCVIERYGSFARRIFDIAGSLDESSASTD